MGKEADLVYLKLAKFYRRVFGSEACRSRTCKRNNEYKYFRSTSPAMLNVKHFCLAVIPLQPMIE